MPTVTQKSLADSLKAPELKLKRSNLEAEYRTAPIGSLRFRQLKEELFQLNQQIDKAQAQDDLLTWQALANVGGLL